MCFWAWAEADRRRGCPPVLTREGDRIVIWLVGEQDAATVPLLAQALERAAGTDAADIVIDLSETTFIDAAIVGELVRSQRLLRQRSRNLSLRAVSGFTRRVLEICDVTSLLDPAPGGGSAGRAARWRRRRRSAR